ncbi:hypothetical protein SEA_TOMAS_251 [Streptomyces phage Tomas]|uniref:Uncharacterized protein n=1 Tax=Streptomyces phage Tomas TaxID=2914443 RepID=A0AA49BSE5_9CAUD|nr:hypothetical protein PP453_gp073 [Streptomyces phage Tomas]UMO76394.1 hypothetical protein SEA_TOMAS_251 [Streptomyces phage Tomas]
MTFTLVVMTDYDEYEEIKNVENYYMKEGALHIICQDSDTRYSKRPIIIANHAFMRVFEGEK